MGVLFSPLNLKRSPGKHAAAAFWRKAAVQHPETKE
jgi:hypothetical protein